MRKIALMTLLLTASTLAADERFFSYNYEADVLPSGGFEFEQWITHHAGKAKGVYSRWDLREEIETGLTDRLTAALYLNAKSVYESQADDDPSSATFGQVTNTEEFAFEGVSTEWKYQIFSPYQSWLGVLTYAELSYNGPEFEAEGKLVLQHNVGQDLIAVVNLSVENEYIYEALSQVIEGKSEFSAGLSWRITPTLGLALEARNSRIWPDNWGWQQSSAWHAGPTFHYANTRWWGNLSVMPQLSGTPVTIEGDGRNLSDYEKMETRLLLGVNF